jgi:MraZ protein
MIRFLGEYEATLDAKCRFLFPTGFRRQIPEGETGSFFINRGFERCLTLYPMKNWEPIFEEISNKNDFDAKVREFRRYFLNGVTVDMDSAGRLLLPKNLMEYAGLQKDIVLLSAIDKIEIWDKDKYQQLFDTFSPEAFSALAQEVMAAKKEG